MAKNLNIEYAERYFPPKYKVCRTSLRPLTFGHVVLLTALGNRFLPWVDREEIGDGDFAQAVFVCSRSWRMAKRWLRFAPWVVKFRLGWILGERSQTEPWKDYGNLIAYFRANCIDTPDLVPNSGKGIVPSHAPLLGFIGARFIQFGMTRDELMDTNFSLLRWEHILIGDREGTMHIRPIPDGVRNTLARNACGIDDAEEAKWRAHFEERATKMKEHIAKAKAAKENKRNA